MDYIRDPTNQLIKLGDTCVIYVSESHRYVLKIEPEGELQTKFGQLRAEDLIDHQYGVRFESKRGWVLPLRLTPELWTQLLPHRTQILYQADISMILLQLDIKPGSIIVESGTGTGSLSHALIRACRPNGFLYTFEINEDRVGHARAEFADHGFGDHVRVVQQNVCEQGFGDDLEGKADACILDLPQTWSAIEHAHKILKPYGSRLCTFSPCVEQVKNNVAKMTELKMKDIVTLETLLRPYEVKVENLRVWDKETLDGLTSIDKKRFENLKNAIGSFKDLPSSEDTNSTDKKKKRDVPTSDSTEQSDVDKDAIALQRALTDPKAPFHSHMLPKKPYAYAKQYNETVSHSGYLTFATKRL